ncbi:MAG: ABC transporter permease [Halobacteria archaeon]
MSLSGVAGEFRAGWSSFLRRPAAVFFTFFFPVLIVGIFGVLVSTSGGLFGMPQGYYLPGYVAVVVLLTPLSRVGSTVARYREFNRFGKLATTPLSRYGWMAAHTVVNAVFIGAATAMVLAVMVFFTDAEFVISVYVPVYVFFGVVMFCGLGAILGTVTDSQDGVIAASNAIGIPMLFLSDTFLTPDMLPENAEFFLDLSPLTYFARGLRGATYPGYDASPSMNLAVLVALAFLFFLVAAYSLPWRR